jgi:NAD(P)-dependent dehydrogenase (short-subunit alcohol dehydrogenase family)
MKRVALITGGGSGLGLATAQRFAREGIKVAIADLRKEVAVSAAASLEGGPHLGIEMDVADEAAVVAGFEEAEAALGPVSILANFAGALRLGEGDGALTNLDSAEWDKIFAVNVKGAFFGIRELARRRTAAPVDHGRIILISSSNAQLGGYQASAAYIASKGAILSLAKGAARELAPLGITVNSIAPGAIDTPMLRASTEAKGGGEGGYSALERIPARRIGVPEEIAAAAAYLVSIDAAYVTGATIDVNGGLRMQ